MKSYYLAAAFGTLLAMTVAAHADNNVMVGTPPAASVTTGDKDFIAKAAQGGMTEIETSKVAKKMSSSDSVKAFAQMMIDDHKKGNAQLKKIAKSLNVPVSRDLDADHKAQVDDLKSAKPSDFDQEYINDQNKDHNEALALFQKEADSGDNAQLKQFAAKLLPTLQMHMQKVKELEAKVPPAATSSKM